MAISYTKDPINYAKALVKLQDILSQEQSMPALSLGFMKEGKSLLLNRIKRMFNMTYSPINIKEKLAASIFIFLFALCITELYAYKAEDKSISLLRNLKELYKNPLDEIYNDTIPEKKNIRKKEKITIIKEKDDKKINLTIEDGEVKNLYIDGKEIPKEEYDNYRDIIKEINPLNGRKAIIIDDINGVFSFGDFDIDIDGWKDVEKFWLKNWEEQHENMMELNDEEMEKHEKEMEKHEKEMEKHGREMEKQNRLLEKHSRMMDRLNKDMFRYRDGNFSFVFPKELHRDSSWQVYEFKIDSLTKIFEQLNVPMDSINRSFRFSFPRNIDKEFGILTPDNNHGIFKMEDLDRLDDLGNNHWNNNLEELIGKQLNKDGFLIAGKQNKVELSGKHLKINGEKQPSNIWNKYKNLFERETGVPLHKDTKLIFEVEGKEAKRKYKAF
jgi:hypothetical protein